MTDSIISSLAKILASWSAFDKSWSRSKIIMYLFSLQIADRLPMSWLLPGVLMGESTPACKQQAAVYILSRPHWLGCKSCCRSAFFADFSLKCSNCVFFFSCYWTDVQKMIRGPHCWMKEADVRPFSNATFSEGGFEFHNSFLRAHCGVWLLVGCVLMRVCVRDVPAFIFTVPTVCFSVQASPWGQNERLRVEWNLSWSLKYLVRLL